VSKREVKVDVHSIDSSVVPPHGLPGSRLLVYNYTYMRVFPLSLLTYNGDSDPKIFAIVIGSISSSTNQGTTTADRRCVAGAMNNNIVMPQIL